MQNGLDLDTMSETTTIMIHQSASREAKTLNKPLKSRLSSRTRTVTTKLQEPTANGDDKQRIDYSEMCKTVKKKANEDIGKDNTEISQKYAETKPIQSHYSPAKTSREGREYFMKVNREP